MTVPNGIDEIIARFGDVHAFIGEDGVLATEWQTEYMGRATLPFSLPLDWNRAIQVNKILCHKSLIPTFEDAFAQIVAHGLQSKVQTYGGCFNYRPQRTGTKLSTHSWGIAIDLNPSTNGQGEAGDMDEDVIKCFRIAGFKWGGDWTGRARDGMHFQYATGY